MFLSGCCLRGFPVVVVMQAEHQRLAFNRSDGRHRSRRGVGDTMQSLMRPVVVVIVNIAF